MEKDTAGSKAETPGAESQREDLKSKKEFGIENKNNANTNVDKKKQFDGNIFTVRRKGFKRGSSEPPISSTEIESEALSFLNQINYIKKLKSNCARETNLLNAHNSSNESTEESKSNTQNKSDLTETETNTSNRIERGTTAGEAENEETISRCEGQACLPMDEMRDVTIFTKNQEKDIGREGTCSQDKISASYHTCIETNGENSVKLKLKSNVDSVSSENVGTNIAIDFSNNEPNAPEYTDNCYSDIIKSDDYENVSSTTHDDIDVTCDDEVDPKIEVVCHSSPSYDIISNEPDTTTASLRNDFSSNVEEQDNPEDLSQRHVPRLSESQMSLQVSGSSPTSADEKVNYMQNSNNKEISESLTEESLCHVSENGDNSAAEENVWFQNQEYTESENPANYRFPSLPASYGHNASALTAQALLGFNDALNVATASFLKLAANQDGGEGTSSSSNSKSISKNMQTEILKMLSPNCNNSPSLPNQSLVSAAAAAAVAASSLFRPPSTPILGTDMAKSHGENASNSSDGFSHNTLESMQVPEAMRAPFGLSDTASNLISLDPRLLSEVQEYRNLLSPDLTSGEYVFLQFNYFTVVIS